MKRKTRIGLMLSLTFVAVFGVVQPVSAMHIMEGYLQPGYCIAWGVICVPFLFQKRQQVIHRHLV